MLNNIFLPVSICQKLKVHFSYNLDSLGFYCPLGDDKVLNDDSFLLETGSFEFVSSILHIHKDYVPAITPEEAIDFLEKFGWYVSTKVNFEPDSTNHISRSIVAHYISGTETEIEFTISNYNSAKSSYELKVYIINSIIDKHLTELKWKYS